jgi:hypothetical protein
METDIESEIEKVKSFFSNKNLLSFISEYENLTVENNSNFHFSTFGINFKDEKVHSVKFYVHILQELSRSEISRFIPKDDGYCRFLKHKENDVEFGVYNIGSVFELKFHVDDCQPIYGFFYLLKNNTEAFKSIESSNSLPDLILDEYISFGVNFEYKNTESLFKEYYYFQPNLKVISYFEKEFGIRLTHEPKLIEFAKGKDYSKINVFIEDTGDFLKHQNIFSESERRVIDYFNKEFNLVNIQYGVYNKGGIKSIYFHPPKKYELSMQINVDTISKLIN